MQTRRGLFGLIAGAIAAPFVPAVRALNPPYPTGGYLRDDGHIWFEYTFHEPGATTVLLLPGDVIDLKLMP